MQPTTIALCAAAALLACRRLLLLLSLSRPTCRRRRRRRPRQNVVAASAVARFVLAAAALQAHLLLWYRYSPSSPVWVHVQDLHLPALSFVVPDRDLDAEDCLALNSREWLEGPRFTNEDPYSNDANADADADDAHTSASAALIHVPFLLREPRWASRIIEQTLAHSSSRFVNVWDNNRTDEASIRVHTIRLMFLSLYVQQHLPSLKEARLRQKHPSCRKAFEQRGVGEFDYECPGSKYVAVYLTGNGLGNNVRTEMFQAFLAGLTSDRIVLFPTRERSDNRTRSGWELASCDRSDYQCMFVPPSPCVPTLLALRNGYRLEKAEIYNLLNSGTPPPRDSSNDNPVWILQPHLGILRMHRDNPPNATLEQFRRYAEILLDHAAGEEEEGVWRLVRRNLFSPDLPPSRHHYKSANRKFQIALTVYALRPNRKTRIHLDDIVSNVGGDLNPELLFGLPIRASDKCIRESECLSFRQYMRAASQQILRHKEVGLWGHVPTIVLTTESTEIVQAQRNFSDSTMLQQEVGEMNFSFVRNDEDVLPDSGWIKDWKWRKDAPTADQNMLSVLAAVKLQLLPRLSMGNCCSNLHSIMNELLNGGLGAASENHFTCMQDLDDIELRICCWTDASCKKQKQNFLEQKKNRIIPTSQR